MTQLEINTALQIHKPINEVFDAIIDPAKMSNYFISESSGKMIEGEKITWKFPEFDEKFPIEVIKISKPELIVFEWEGAPGKKLKVEMRLESKSENDTLLRITEGKMDTSDEGIRWLGRNSEGWANFLACLKAYLEFGINLRKGGYDFMKEPK
ncbi:SRPBCC domain-containing protein [Gramella jeungdoensis]|uniref:SRPBCC domain-containing protein n=1 Tax=Gramella jeungdoensis TaxID=708091 RepID=A0ABT0Z671_9FLAO|nr:SRPBCC domain-containing protein [Gramella jeungdoensis]MCM8570910.1 SRPBCC domain-containing protein [Gramella jeungdoensis]